MQKSLRTCPDCRPDHPQMDRREFIQATGVAAVASAALVSPTATNADDPAEQPPSETLVTQLHESLNDQQKKLVCFPFDDPLRQQVNNNWHITQSRIGKDFDQDQQALIREIFLKLHSEEYAESVVRQVEQDNRSGMGSCSVALFGEPGTGQFEFVFTGRHVTRRCDGDSVAGKAFGGPIFYGHSAAGFNEPADHRGNAYWFQAVRANELFAALDGKQRKIALRDNPRGEQGTETVKLKDKSTELAGLPVSELADDQKELARKVMDDLLAPFREVDRAESMRLVEQAGFEDLHFSYFSNLDIGDDGVWDVWQVEGPAMIWYFRGAPHVHTWVHIADGSAS